jgi:DNA-binding MarR family transcriptional regulator
MSVSTTDVAVGADLGQALLRVTRGLLALKLSPQRLGFDRRIDRGAHVALSRIADIGPVRLSEVAATLSLDLSSVSRQVRVLEDAGLVTRTPDPDDRRASLLAVTLEGEALVQRMQLMLSRIVSDALAEWSERDRATLSTLLGRLADDLSPSRANSLVSHVLDDSAQPASS